MNGSRRYRQLSRRGGARENQSGEGDELWSGEELLGVSNVLARERSLRGRS